VGFFFPVKEKNVFEQLVKLIFYSASRKLCLFQDVMMA
jgi:hypothetical protein